MYYFVSALIGFCLGYFFSLKILLILTVGALGYSIYLFATLKEMGMLVAYAYTSMLIITGTCMWITYYVATKQSWIQNFIHTHLFRS